MTKSADTAMLDRLTWKAPSGSSGVVFAIITSFFSSAPLSSPLLTSYVSQSSPKQTSMSWVSSQKQAYETIGVASSLYWLAVNSLK